MARYRVRIEFPTSTDPDIVREFTVPDGISAERILKARDAASAWYAANRPSHIKMWKLTYEQID